MRLVIAEKPSVARSLAPVLGADTKLSTHFEGNGYLVSWCFGHLMEMQKPNDYCAEWAEEWSFEQLPMIPDKFKFVVKSDAKAQFVALKKLMNDPSVDEIICATDADREGECIFRYVYQGAGCRKPVKRLWISSLEDKSIKDGFRQLKPDAEYDSTYYAGYSRARADWLVGMNYTRLFSVRYNSLLTIGRVQTPTLAMIVKRDYQVSHFVKEQYFTVELDCGSFTASSERFDDRATAEALAQLVNGKQAVVTEYKSENKTVKPPKLYDLTTLQRDANKQFGYTAKQSLEYTQSLYEKALVTYPRTDSQYITDDQLNTAESPVPIVHQVFPAYGKTPDTFSLSHCVNNEKVTGHHAIMPTDNILGAEIDKLPDGERNILMLVSARLILAAGEPNIYNAVSVTLNCENTEFKASGKTVLQNGWKAIEQLTKKALYNKKADKDEKTEDKVLPSLTENQVIQTVGASIAEHWTAPPKPYTEDTLLSAMEHAGAENYDDDTEKKGLGTPATRAAIIDGLATNKYIERKGKQILSTEKGRNLIAVVPPEVKAPKMTANWEMLLQQIERGNYSADTFMKNIVTMVKDVCAKYSQLDSSVSFKSTPTVFGKCPNCGAEVKKGKFGAYCTAKCGMNVGFVFSKELTDKQIIDLLSGKAVKYTYKGYTKTVYSQIEPFSYQTKDGKTVSGFQWQSK